MVWGGGVWVFFPPLDAYSCLFKTVSLPRSLSQLVLSPASPKHLLKTWNVLSLALSRSLDIDRLSICFATSQGGALPCVLTAPCGLLTAEKPLSPLFITGLESHHSISWRTHPWELVPGPSAQWKLTNPASQMRNSTAVEAQRCWLPINTHCFWKSTSEWPKQGCKWLQRHRMLMPGGARGIPRGGIVDFQLPGCCLQY